MSMPRITTCVYCGSPPDMLIDAGSHAQDIGRIRDAERENMLARIAELEKAHARYEKVRRLNPREFQAIYSLNIERGMPFDDLIDGLSR